MSHGRSHNSRCRLDVVDAALDRRILGLLPLHQEHRDGDAARIPMMMMTIRSSIRVNPLCPVCLDAVAPSLCRFVVCPTLLCLVCPAGGLPGRAFRRNRPHPRGGRASRGRKRRGRRLLLKPPPSPYSKSIRLRSRNREVDAVGGMANQPEGVSWRGWCRCSHPYAVGPSSATLVNGFLGQLST